MMQGNYHTSQVETPEGVVVELEKESKNDVSFESTALHAQKQ